MTTEEEVEFTVDSIPEVDPGVYTGKLIAIRKFSYEVPETGETRHLIEWKFNAKDGDGNAIVDNDGKVLELGGVTSTATGPLSKWFSWVVALIGAAAVAPNAKIRGSDLIGKQALITVGPDKKGYPKVQNLTAMPRTRAAAAAPAPLPDEDVMAPVALRAVDGKVPGTEFDDLPF